ncbi:MAG: type IV pilus modification PilV family protein [Candidatus Rokuibacteriota bacterium]
MRRRQAGFTLLEVLVALVILTVTGVAVLQLFGGGLRLARASGEHLEATLLATAKLAELPAGSVEEEVTDGTEGPYRWTRQVTIDPALLPFDANAPQAERVRIARVSVDVRWGRNRHVELITLRTWGVR